MGRFNRRFLDDGFDHHICRSGNGDLNDPALAGYGPRLRQWMLRLLCECGAAWSDSFAPARFISDTASLLPVPAGIEGGEGGEALVSHYRKLSGQIGNRPAPVDGALASNLNVLAAGLRMNEVEKDILAMLVIYRALPSFEHLVDCAFFRSDAGRIAWQVASMLGCCPREIERAISPTSVLSTAGLIRLDENAMGTQVPMVLELNRRVLRLLTHSTFDVNELLRYAARDCRTSGLELADFDHMDSQRDLLIRYLEAVKRENYQPASILFDGPPGVGKSELARLVAAHLGFDAYEINELDSDGDPALPGERVQYLRICQHLIERRDKGLIIFDEADAVMGGHLDDHRRAMRGTKAGLINLVEGLKVPIIWITNHGDLIDPAILRRLDLTVRFRRLPAAARERMLRKAMADVPGTPGCLERLSKTEEVTPARIAQADKVARLLAGEDATERVQLFEQVIDENLDLHREREAQENHHSFELPYRLASVNADEDLPALVKAMQNNPSARMCLYGPPGTGKTRFVKYLAAQCDLKLAEYRTSDLLDKWVGSSERNIRRMFEDNDSPDRLLFLDEADSLVASRAGAKSNWEVNQVNELLKGLECFQGLFVASTNLMDRLDSAVMRRLDFKIHFGWLQPEQRWRLFLDLAAHVGLCVRGAAATRARRVIDRLECLTPGDFAMLARRLTIRQAVDSGEALAHMLEKEMHAKPEFKARASIGFTASV